jgi:hypothetical protein
VLIRCGPISRESGPEGAWQIRLSVQTAFGAF